MLLLGRTVARIAGCCGIRAEVTGDLDELRRSVLDHCPHLVLVGPEVLDETLQIVNGLDDVQLLLWSSDDITPLLATLHEARVSHLFGLRYPDAPPRPWELVAVLHRLVSRKAPSPADYLSWGAQQFGRTPASVGDRDAIVAEVEGFCATLVGERAASTLANVAHELLMNAMYDAPVDEKGRPLFAHDRTAPIDLDPAQRPRFVCGCDGSRLLLSVEDPFGRLRREHVFGGLARALSSGTMDSSRGGAGLGLMVIYRATTMMFFDVLPGVRTRATVIVELDVPQRELRTLPRSIHFFREEP